MEFPIAEVKALTRRTMDMLEVSKDRWRRHRRAVPYRTAEALHQHLELLDLALDRRSVHVGDLFAKACGALSLAERAFEPHANGMATGTLEVQDRFSEVVSDFCRLAEGVQAKVFKDIAPYLTPEDEFADDLSSLQYIKDAMMRTGPNDHEGTVTHLGAGFSELHRVDVPWESCKVLLDSSTTAEPVAKAGPSALSEARSTVRDVCVTLFPFDRSVALPSLRAVFEDPFTGVPIVVVGGDDLDDDALMKDVDQLASRFSGIRVIASPAHASLAPFYERDSRTPLERYFRFIGDHLDEDEYTSLVDIAMVDGVIQADEASAQLPHDAHRQLFLKEIHIRLKKSCATTERETARLYATYSDIYVDVSDTFSQSLNFPETAY